MYKDKSCRSSPQLPPTSQVAEEVEDDLAASGETSGNINGENEGDAFSGLSESNSDPEYEYNSRPSTTSSSSSTTGSLLCRSKKEIKRSHFNSDVRLLRKIGFIASRVRILSKYYGDFNLVNPYSPTKQKKQLQEILEKHSIVDPDKEIKKTEGVTGSLSTPFDGSVYQHFPTERSLQESSAGTSTVRRKSSTTSVSASIIFLEDLLIQFYEDNRNKVTIIKRRRGRRNSREDTASKNKSKASKVSNNHLIIMSSKTANSSVERLLQSSSTDNEFQLGEKDNPLAKQQQTATLFNVNTKHSSQQQPSLHHRGSILLQPTLSDDITKRRRASDCSAHLGNTLGNQLQVNFKNNNFTKFPYNRGSCSGTTDNFLTAANTIGSHSTIILSKSCSNVDGEHLLREENQPALVSSEADSRKDSITSATNAGDGMGNDSRCLVGSVTSGVNTPIANVSSSCPGNGNNDYSVVQLNNTIIQCHFNDDDFRALVKELKRKVEYTERMNWLCLSKRPMGPPHRKSSLLKHQEVKKRFLEICDTAFSEEVKSALRLPSFDSYDWSDADVIHLMQTMFIELGFMDKFNIPAETLREWLYEVYKHYNEVPFHNFRHCFCVAQMMYAITRQANLLQRLGELECLILLVSCICHDLDHPGYNNIYQINARTELALRYNDISPLENHHCSIAFRLLEHPECNIFKNFSRDTFNQIREGIIRCILATDMARHNEILTQFKEITPIFDYNNRAHINLLCMILIKVADISNEARPMDVAEPWLDRLLQEFFAQSAAEKSEGLPVTPFMDPDKVSKPGSQVRFIGLVLLPLFEALGDLVPEITELIIIPVRVALDYYKRLNDAQNKARKSVTEAISENTSGNFDCTATTSTPSNISSTTTTTTAGGNLSPQMPRSQSGISMKSRRSIPSQKSASRTSVDEPQGLPAELHDLPEGSESGDSETATEVDVAEKTSKFKVDTEGSANNRSKPSHSSSRKSSREKRPSMIGEICSSGGGQRMRCSYGNIHGYHSNRSHFGSNRAVSLDQYSTNRRLSDGLQQVISDSNVFYNRHNRGSIETNTATCCVVEDLNMNATGIINHSQASGRQITQQNVPNLEARSSFHSTTISENITGRISCSNISSIQLQQQHTLQQNIIDSSTSNNGNLSPTRPTNVIKSKSGNTSVIPSAIAMNVTSTTNNKHSWKARFKQFSDYFSFSFDKTNKRLGSARNSPSSTRNNNSSGLEPSNQAGSSNNDPINSKQGICCTISNSFQSPSILQKNSENHDDLTTPTRHRAYSLDVPCTRSNPRYSGSSSGGGGDSSRKSSHLDGVGSMTGDENNSNNTLHSSSGGCSEIATCMPPPICIGSVDKDDTVVFVTNVSKSVPPVSLVEHSLNLDFGSTSDPPKI